MRRSGKDHKLLLQVLQKYSSGIASPDEEDFVNRYFEILEQRYGSNYELSEAQKNELEAEIRMDLMGSIGMKEKSGVFTMHAFKWRKIAVAASVLIVFGLTAFLLWNRTTDRLVNKPSREVLPSTHQIQPGTNKAILTLADGSAITLDNSANGVLATQGNSNVIKLANGEIVYSASNTPESKIIYNTMSTPNGGTYRLVLPDGSKVWLNAASSITYPTSFIGKQRMVKTTGEVYFEVARDTERPFTVTLPDQSEIQVLGTHFNANAYGDNGDIQTTLIEGKVKIARSGAAVTLKPGQQAVTTLNRDPVNRTPSSSQKIKVTDNIDIEQVTAWRNGYFYFNRADIKTVMFQIARWYDIEVVYEGAPPNDKFIGELPKNAQFSEVLRALEKIGVHFRIDSKKVIVTR